MLDKELLQKSKYALRHWPYYERNINILSHYPKVNAVALFKSIKELEQEEIRLLAERYYKSTDLCVYSETLGDYMTVKPVEIRIIADKLNMNRDEVTSRLKEIEIKVGRKMLTHRAVAERKRSIDNIEKMKELTLAPFFDGHEINILEQAFAEIKVYREIAKELTDNDGVHHEDLRLQRLGL